MTSQNLIYLSQLVDVLESWFFFLFPWFFRSVSSNMSLFSHFCDAVTSWRHVMTSLNLIHLSQLVDELRSWFFFCFHGFVGHWVQNYVMTFHSYDVMTSWRYDMSGRHRNCYNLSWVMIHWKDDRVQDSMVFQRIVKNFNELIARGVKNYCYIITFLHALLKSHKSMVSSKNKQSHITHDSLGFGDKSISFQFFFRNVNRLRLFPWSSVGRLFHAARQANANARGPMVTVFVLGMNRSPDAPERRCDRPAIELTGTQHLDRYEGAVSWIQRYASTHSLKRTRSEMSSQWSWQQMASDTWPLQGSWRMTLAAARITPDSWVRI